MALNLEDGIAAAKAILDLPTGGLFSSDTVSDLPYPGIGVPPARPPVTLAYVGGKFLVQIMKFYLKRTSSKLLVDGCEGCGKSSLLRAFSCVVYADIGLRRSKEVLVCIWNLEAALMDNAVQVLKDALLFAYTVKWEGQLHERGFEKGEDVGDETEITEEVKEDPVAKAERIEDINAERQLVTDEILKIGDMKGVCKFVDKRIKEQEEVYTFIVDGWEILDADKADHNSRRILQYSLDTLFSLGGLTIVGLSSNSTALCRGVSTNSLAIRKDAEVMIKGPFDEVQYHEFIKRNILGQLDGIRREDIKFYTGWVSILLEDLAKCCNSFEKLLEDAPYERDVVVVKRRYSLKLMMQKLDIAECSEEKLVEQLCDEDDDAWEEVKRMFRQKMAGMVNMVINTIKLEPQPGRNYLTLDEMGEMNGAHFLKAEHRYCSGLIQRMYIEGFMAKEAAARLHCRGVWIDYCKFLTSQPTVNWASLGWLAEDLVADVIVHRSIYLGPYIGYITGSNVKLEEFASPRPITIAELFEQLSVGRGIFYKPLGYRLAYIDGLLVYLNAKGRLLIIAMQSTVNVDTHMKSALMFSHAKTLAKWFPDIRSELEAGEPRVELVFVYIGNSRRVIEASGGDSHAVEEKDVPQVTGKTRSVVHLINVGYKRVIVGFTECLAKDGGLDVEEVLVLQKVEAMRSKVPSVSLADMGKLTKNDILEMAGALGIPLDPALKKSDLLSELEDYLLD